MRSRARARPGSPRFVNHICKGNGPVARGGKADERLDGLVFRSGAKTTRRAEQPPGIHPVCDVIDHGADGAGRSPPHRMLSSTAVLARWTKSLSTDRPWLPSSKRPRPRCGDVTPHLGIQPVPAMAHQGCNSRGARLRVYARFVQIRSQPGRGPVVRSPRWPDR